MCDCMQCFAAEITTLNQPCWHWTSNIFSRFGGPFSFLARSHIVTCPKSWPTSEKSSAKKNDFRDLFSLKWYPIGIGHVYLRYTPEDSHRTWKWWFGRWFSFSRGVFSGSMLIFRGVLGEYDMWFFDVFWWFRSQKIYIFLSVSLVARAFVDLYTRRIMCADTQKSKVSRYHL